MCLSNKYQRNKKNRLLGAKWRWPLVVFACIEKLNRQLEIIYLGKNINYYVTRAFLLSDIPNIIRISPGSTIGKCLSFQLNIKTSLQPSSGDGLRQLFAGVQKLNLQLEILAIEKKMSIQLINRCVKDRMI